jgi:hypothetical protein
VLGYTPHNPPVSAVKKNGREKKRSHKGIAVKLIVIKNGKFK